MTAPDPLVPIDVDLRDLDAMLIDVRRMLTSDTWIAGIKDPRVGHAAMSLWLESFHQVPAGSLPNNDDTLARLSMCPNIKEWRRVKDRVLDKFVLCSDGRLYHPVVAEKALEAHAYSEKQSRRGKAGAAKRWGTNGKSKAHAVPKQYLSNGASNARANAQAMLGDSKEKEKDVPDAYASGASGASPPDPDRELWHIGMRLLTAAGASTDRARAILGKHFKADKEKLGRIIGEMAVKPPIEPIAYLERAMNPPPRGLVT